LYFITHVAQYLGVLCIFNRSRCILDPFSFEILFLLTYFCFSLLILVLHCHHQFLPSLITRPPTDTPALIILFLQHILVIRLMFMFTWFPISLLIEIIQVLIPAIIFFRWSECQHGAGIVGVAVSVAVKGTKGRVDRDWEGFPMEELIGVDSGAW